MPDSERQKRLDLAMQIRWSAVERLLATALSREGSREEYHAEVRAQGVAKAAQMLSDRYWFAVTNPPFLALTKSGEDLKEFCAENHPEAKKDLATCFIERLRKFAKPGAEYAVVCPQNWLFLGSDKKFRQKLLKEQRWLAVVRFGPGAFETISGEVMQAANLIFANRTPTKDDAFFGLDASAPRGAQEKAAALRESSLAKEEVNA
jgi:type I restriction-modification system DNA methylase subunit